METTLRARALKSVLLGAKIGAMEKLTKKALASIESHTKGNDAEILKSKNCSCLFCRHTYDARKVSDWIDDPKGMTAICPECGMDAVVGDASGYTFDKDTLRSINKALYGGEFMSNHPEALRTYVDRYEDAKITHKPENEKLYLEYLGELLQQGEPTAAFKLGNFFQYGSEFSSPDLEKAFSYFSSDLLSSDGVAFDRLGLICLAGIKGKPDPEGAYLAFTKSSLSGCGFGLMHSMDCYLKGIFVPQDFPFIGHTIIDRFAKIYREYAFGEDRSPLPFAMIAKRAMDFFLLGFPKTDESRYNAAHPFALQALYAYEEYLSLDSHPAEFLIQERNEVELVLQEIERHLDLSPNSDPLLDQDTFYDSYRNNYQSPMSAENAVTATSGDFNEEEHTFTLTLHYKKEPFLIDEANCFCGFAPKDVTFSFREVEKVKFLYKKPFEVIKVDLDEVISFYHRSEKTGELSLVGEIRMMPPHKGGEELSEDAEGEDEEEERYAA